METVEQRLQVLEREFQRSRWANRILILAVVATACIAGAQGEAPLATPTSQKPTPPSDTDPADVEHPPEKEPLRTVEAEQFVLLDRQGRSRAKMAVTDDGPTISMFDEEGQKRLELSHTKSASGLRLFDSDESPVVSLLLPHKVAAYVDPAHLEIRNSQGRSLIRPSGLTVDDADEHQRLILALINGNFPLFGVSRSGQAGPASVQITPERLAVHNEQGYPLFSVATTHKGGAFLSMSHPDHERSLQISTGSKDYEGPVMSLSATANADGSGGKLSRLQLGLHKDHEPFIRIVNSDGHPVFTAPSE